MSQLESSPEIVNTSSGSDGSVKSEADKQFDELCRQYYHAWFRYHPEEAVEAGVYEYASMLKSYEQNDIGALISLNQKMQSALEEINFDELDQSRQIDHRIVQGAIRIELHDLEENDWRYRDPVQYVPVNAIYQLLVHPGQNVHSDIKQRLQSFPEYLRGAKIQLSQYPERVVPEWANMARGMAASGVGFIRDLKNHPLIKARFSNPARLQPLIDEAAASLADFAEYLSNCVIPGAEGRFASGINRFNRILNECHFLSVGAQDVLEYGEKLAAETEQHLLELSKKLCGQADIALALETVRQEHPQPEKLLEQYRDKMQVAYKWLLDADIVSIPQTQSLKVQETPHFLRDVIPFAAYQPPMPLDDQQHGLYYVTTTTEKAQLAEHNFFSIDMTSVHEAFPGHHLQFVIANQVNQNNYTRLVNASASMYEGWALYCEQLVYEQGYYDKPEHQFILLRDRLWRALRIIIDVRLHTTQFSFEQAAQLLVNRLGFDISQARSEISWYCHAAGTPLCYAIGREIILKAREKLVSENIPEAGNNLHERLKVFHDSLLSHGSIALPLVVQSVFGDDTWQQVHDEIFCK